jgi:hypothetical protein
MVLTPTGVLTAVQVSADAIVAILKKNATVATIVAKNLITPIGAGGGTVSLAVLSRMTSARLLSTKAATVVKTIAFCSSMVVCPAGLLISGGEPPLTGRR